MIANSPIVVPEIDLWGVSHIGNVRKNNEDAYAFAPEFSLAVVADGMGGAASGEVAAAITVDTIIKHVGSFNGAGEPEIAILKEAVRIANQSVWAVSQERENCKGMGSTVVAASWRRGRLSIVNVGDSRAYLLRGDVLQQASCDQNLANELRTKLGLTEQEISQFPHRNVLTMAIGTAPEVVAEAYEDDFVAGDVVLLCSDGLYGPVPETKIKDALTSEAGLPEIGRGLIDAALQSGGRDNITLVLLRHGGRRRAA